MAVPAVETINVTGKSGRTYVFDIFSKYSDWNSVPGNYLTLRKGVSGSYDTIYMMAKLLILKIEYLAIIK